MCTDKTYFNAENMPRTDLDGPNGFKQYSFLSAVFKAYVTKENSQK